MFPAARRVRIVAAFLLSVSITSLGCRPQQHFYFFEDGDLSHYVDRATDIEYPDVEVDSLPDATQAEPPLTLSNPNPREYWDLPLQEAIRIALTNARVIRVLDQPDFLLRNSDFATTVYDPALAEANPRFGPEAALAAFDAQFVTSMFWEKNDTPQNSATIQGFRIMPESLQQDLGTFQAQLRKTMATGGTWTLSHSVMYDQNNRPFRRHPSDWLVNIEAQFRQPILQGNGVQFNRIAGPGAIPGLYAGVIVARINTDITLADFEMQVRNLVFDVERAYWELYYAYRVLDAMNMALAEALDTWQKVRAEYETGKVPKMDEGVARHQYYFFRGLVEQAQSNLFRQEAALRQLMGIAVSDGRLIRPSDEPTTARIVFDWHECHAEALARAVEIRRQKWRVKQREMELIAAKNFLLPRLDAVGRYRWLGLGDEMINSGDYDPVPTDIGSDAYSSLLSGDYQEWQLGFEMSIPLGFRREMAAVRHAQLQLARERAVLQEIELDVVRMLAEAFRSMDDSYQRAQTNLNRLLAAQAELQGYKEKEAAGLPVRQASLNFILDSQRRVAEAMIDYFRSLVDYNIAIAQVHLRKSSLLEYNGIHLAEGPWPAKAYFDAYRRARARDAALYIDYGVTEPGVISRGPYNQEAGQTRQGGAGAQSTEPELQDSQIQQGDAILMEIPQDLSKRMDNSTGAADKTQLALGETSQRNTTRSFTPQPAQANLENVGSASSNWDIAELDLRALAAGSNTDSDAASASAPVQLTAYTEQAETASVPASGTPQIRGRRLTWNNDGADDATVADLSIVENHRTAAIGSGL